jgi:3-hydroxyacyl-CoA dehydrogenase/enoyl-CoA hydratase/3-hydroxybutyryl-CoA epimerase
VTIETTETTDRSPIAYRVEDGCAIVTWDDPARAVNVLTGPALAALDAAIARAAADEAVRGVVLTGGKDGVFVAGGDLDQIATLGAGDLDAADMFRRTGAVLAQLRRQETCGKPVVAAINGVCLGGGLEIALACHRRIAVDSRHAKIGLPEAGLGLMPGAGGTQRLPRLVGVPEALGLIMMGKQLSPEEALAKGVVHEVVAPSDLIDAAKRWILGGGSAVQPWDAPGFTVPGGGADSATFAQTMMGSVAMTHMNTYENMPSQRAILAAVYEGLHLPMERATTVETRWFITLLQDATARSMLRTLFFSLEECKKGARRPADVPPTSITKVGVVGAGLMGQGIALVCAKVGIEAVLLDRSAALAERAKGQIAAGLERKLAKGQTSAERNQETLARIGTTSDYADLAGCDVVVEAVFEDRAIKAAVTRAIEEVVGPDCLLATNTSGLPITELAQAARHPERFIGMHFFSPVERMQMVEVIMGARTSRAALARAWDLILALRKAAIVVADGPGFYTSRVFGTFITEGMELLVEGVAPALIENAAKAAGMPMPPLAISDMVGLGTMHKVADQARRDAEAAGRAWEPTAAQRIIARLIEEHDRWGATPPPHDDGAARRPGVFYEYGEGRSKWLWPALGATLAGLVAPAAAQPGVAEVKDRYLFAQCLEAVRCLEEGVISDVRDGDVGVIMAVGFPAFTGGPFTHIDNYGLEAFVGRARELAAAHGPRFEPPAGLVQRAAEGRPFYG